jgi:hypothetical protein
MAIKPVQKEREMQISTEFGPIELNWKPEVYQTKEAAAKALYSALCDLCKAIGMDPAHEVWIKSPAESERHGYVGRHWHVCWESGPYEWSAGLFASGPWGYCESYWGFDLIFTD